MQIACPTCNKKTEYDKTNHHRPFCSEKCKLIDLGAWASEKYHIPGDTNEIQTDED